MCLVENLCPGILVDVYNLTQQETNGSTEICDFYVAYSLLKTLYCTIWCPVEKIIRGSAKILSGKLFNTDIDNKKCF